MLKGNCLSPFYGQLLDIWYELIDIEPKSPSDIVNENIFTSKQIPIAIDARVREDYVAKSIKKKTLVDRRPNNFWVQCN